MYLALNLDFFFVDLDSMMERYLRGGDPKLILMNLEHLELF